MSFALQAIGLSKTFGSGAGAVKALDDFSLEIPRGGVFGVLGPNGAGKSTLFRLALGLIKPTAGEVRLLEQPAGDPAALRRIGSMIETPRFHPYLTARETLAMLSAQSGVASPDITGWLERVGIAEAADRKTKGFSVGMKQRLGLAAALITRPEAVILDEPTSGMDPSGILEIRALIRELANRDGVTVILASHQLDEVQRVCNRVAFLAKGRLTAIEDLSQTEEQLRILATPQAAVLDILGKRGTADGGYVLAAITRAEAPDLIRALATRGIDIVEARWVSGDLERAYLVHTGT
ncbi:ABC transporter ATP-binding protein [Caulobacter sp. NIBR1757]|uniref:ABC transporter ATP-binding protein n=1 Tax=Caulobacter sp. NIBR1757 TaxID=3016000 RepID=UPI0022F133C9|nr:ABC transporter ATP-binding protein [Caulobacter sp. NIBR1757]WGM38840.1 Vitamin B12 import ATP-binding protein BtuD [Caulobacter sp. NIBR1757]